MVTIRLTIIERLKIHRHNESTSNFLKMVYKRISSFLEFV